MIYVNDNLAISFQHIVTDYSGSRATVCQIVEVKNNDTKVLAEAVAQCHFKDRFNKEVGRKLSLRRAVQEAFPRGPDRAAVWNAYFNR